jgi:hypothetical protein
VPRATLKLRPGVNTYETQALNEAAIFSCNLIRLTPDPTGLGIVEKLGGWARYFASAIQSQVRALWAWAGLDGVPMLAIGSENQASLGTAWLQYIRQGGLNDITPHVQQDNPAVAATTTINSNLVTLNDPASNINSISGVFVPAHISVGGVIVFGMYPTIATDANDFAVQLFDFNNNPVNATTSVTGGGAVAQFTTVSGTSTVTVTLNNHGYSVGSTYPVLIRTTVGGITLVGNYIVQSVTDINNFTILGPQNATASTSASINGGNARYNFLLTSGPLPAGTGWGVGGWGVGGWGSGVAPSNPAGTNIDALDWSLGNWGDTLIASPDKTVFNSPDGTTLGGGPIYYWSLNSNTFNAQPIVVNAAPVANTGFFIAMPQRQIVAFGSTITGVQDQDPLLVKWCDVNNFLSWLPTPTNLAGSFRLTRGSRIVGGGQVGQQGLLWTDVGLWTMNFIGSSGGTNLAYGFNEIAQGCGLLAKHAWCTLGGVTFWVGAPTPTAGNATSPRGQIFMLSANGVQPIPCPVLDRLFQNLDPNNVRKVVMAANSSFNEITIHYPSITGGTGENDSYIKFNVMIGTPNGWDYGGNTGTLVAARTAWVDQSVVGQPVGAGSNMVLYQHEISNDADGQAMLPFFQTGFFQMNEAELQSFVDLFVPDFKWGQVNQTTMNAQVQLTFFVKSYPGDTVRTYGPFTVSSAVKFATPRFRGALVALQFSSSDTGSWWRLAANRYRFQQAGKFY